MSFLTNWVDLRSVFNELLIAQSFEEEVGPDGKRIPKAKLSIKEKTAQQKRQAESEAAREMEALLDQNRDQDSDTEQSEVSSSAAYVNTFCLACFVPLCCLGLSCFVQILQACARR
jgi:hypothetical protein